MFRVFFSLSNVLFGCLELLLCVACFPVPTIVYTYRCDSGMVVCMITDRSTLPVPPHLPPGCGRAEQEGLRAQDGANSSGTIGAARQREGMIRTAVLYCDGRNHTLALKYK